jgi:shikimate dehydrogenase
MGIPYAEVIGDPVAHSKSPVIHKFWLGKLGIEGDYRATRVQAAGLADYFAARRTDPAWRGCNVTLPHKLAVIPLLDELTHPAEAIGAVNIVTLTARHRRLAGHNSDGPGFLDLLSGWPGLDRLYRLANVIGTGGGAAAVTWALLQHGIFTLVYSRDYARAESLLRRLGETDMDFAQLLEELAAERTEMAERPDSSDLLINASPLGMRGFPPLDVSLKGWSPATLVCDLVYDPVETPLLRTARERGHPVLSGLEMLVAQAARAFYLFFEAHPPRQHDAELKELLTS